MGRTLNGRMPKDFYQKQRELAKAIGITTAEAIKVYDKVLREIIMEQKKGKRKKNGIC